MDTLETLNLTPETGTPETTADAVVETPELAATAATEEVVETTAGEEGAEEGQEGAEETVAEEFAVEVSHPKRDGELAEKFNLAVPDQKTADALRYHLNRSKDYGKLAKEHETAQEAVRTIEAMERDPVAGMFALAEDPKVGAQFLTTFLKENYLDAVDILAGLGLDIKLKPGVTQRELDLTASNAKHERMNTVRQAQQQAQGNVVQQRFTARGRQVVTDLAATIPFGDDDDREMFEAMSAKALGTLYRSNQYASPAEMTAALQGIVGKFTGRATQTVKAKTQPRDAGGQFVKAKAVHDKMRKVGSGSNGLAPATPAFKPGTTLEQMFGG